MRQDLIAVSASSLVAGVMCLVLGLVLNPASGVENGADALQVIDRGSTRVLGAAVLYFVASVTLLLGLPALMSLFQHGARRLGQAALLVFSVGVVGTAGFAMLLVLLRAVVINGNVTADSLDAVIRDGGLSAFLYGWVAAFYLGVLLLAVALLVAGRTPRWSTILLFLFVLMAPLSLTGGETVGIVQVLALAVSFTAIAIAAVNNSHDLQPESLTG